MIRIPNPFLTSLAMRELRGAVSKFWLPAVGIAIAVAGFLATRSFSAKVVGVINTEARSITGADLELRSSSPLTSAQTKIIHEQIPPGSRTTTVTGFISMALEPKSKVTRIVDVRVVGKEYPFYGILETEPRLTSEKLAEVGPDGLPPLFAQPEISAQLNVRVGDIVKLGEIQFRLAAIVKHEPGLGGALLSFGPKVWFHESFLEKTGLASRGSRLRVRTLIAVKTGIAAKDAELLELRDRLTKAISDPAIQVNTYKDSNRQVEKAFEKLDLFLASLSTLLFFLSGIGILYAVRAHLQSREKTIAILRCVGGTRWQVVSLFGMQAILIGLFGGVLGVVLGITIDKLLPQLVMGLIRLPTESGIGVAEISSALAMGTLITFLFSLYSLVELSNVRPLFLLRKEEKPLFPTRSKFALGGLILVGFWFVTAHLTKSIPEATKLLGGISVLGISLYALSWLGLYAISQIVYAPARAITPSILVPFALRYGLRNLLRNRGQSSILLAILGMACFLLFGSGILREGMVSEMTTPDPERPELLLIDIGADQKSALTQTVEDIGHFRLIWAQWIRSRFSKINGHSIDPELEPENRSREINVSERQNLYASESVSEGAFWKPDFHCSAADEKTVCPVSLEEHFAARFKLKLGDEIVTDIQGVPVKGKVTSLRHVKWSTFQPNFFILFPPQSLEGAPATWVVSVQGTAKEGAGTKEKIQQRIVQKLPNITVIDVQEAGERILRLTDQLNVVVTFLSLFVLFAGLSVISLILFDGVDKRGMETALLKVLGGTQTTLTASVLAEFLSLTVLAQIGGAVGAYFLGYFVLGPRFGFEPTLWTLSAAEVSAGTLMLTFLTSLFASRKVFRQKAALVLKAD